MAGIFYVHFCRANVGESVRDHLRSPLPIFRADCPAPSPLAETAPTAGQKQMKDYFLGGQVRRH